MMTFEQRIEQAIMPIQDGGKNNPKTFNMPTNNVIAVDPIHFMNLLLVRFFQPYIFFIQNILHYFGIVIDMMLIE